MHGQRSATGLNEHNRLNNDQDENKEEDRDRAGIKKQRQSSLAETLSNSSMTQDIFERNLIKCIAINNLSFTLFDNPSFGVMLTSYLQMNGVLNVANIKKIPCRKTISTTILDKVFKYYNDKTYEIIASSKYYYYNNLLFIIFLLITGFLYYYYYYYFVSNHIVAYKLIIYNK